ncbi:3-oxoacyl-ACP reductase, partial [Methylobacterium trifolii]
MADRILEGRVAVVTGASRGLGLGLVETFLARGWRVT